MEISTLIILILIGLVAGALSGFVGVGGGIIIVPALVYLLGLSQFEAQGTSLLLMLPPIGILAAMNYYQSGAVNWKYASVIALTFVVGGYFGSKISIFGAFLGTPDLLLTFESTLGGKIFFSKKFFSIFF